MKSSHLIVGTTIRPNKLDVRVQLHQRGIFSILYLLLDGSEIHWLGNDCRVVEQAKFLVGNRLAEWF